MAGESSRAARILVVDDMATNRALLRHVLRPPAYVVTEASSGEQALDLLDTQSFDVVVLDVMLPGITGFEVCDRLRSAADSALLPVIMLTSLDRPEDVAKGLQVGATDFITKPFNAIELTARINSAVERKRVTDRLDDTESVLFALARMVEAKDSTTGDHCDRLSHSCVVFGEALGLAFEDLEALRRGGVLHDIGKLGVPDAILLKPGPLTEEEWAVMRRHPIIGTHLCSPLRTMRKTVDIIRCHHEKWDGSGYPEGLQGEQIPLLARVFQIADVYDALTSARSYKPAYPHAKVCAILEEETAKGYWDPDLMRVFLQLLARSPEALRPQGPGPADGSVRIFDDMVASGILGWGSVPRG